MIRAVPMMFALALLACSDGRDRTLAACREAVPPIPAGYGARGPHAVRALTLASPRIPEEEVSVHLPKEASGPVPVVLFAHAFATSEREDYRAFLEHIASRGYAAIFVPYMVDDPRHGPRYEALWEGFRTAVRALASELDPKRLGIVGHSYGAGAAPFLALRALEEGWGERALFLHLLAPFYPLQVTKAELAAFPEHAKVLIQVFEDDNATDHRIAIGLHADLGVPEKDYVLVLSDQRGRCRLPAIHTVPQSKGFGARDDAVDEWAVYRLFDALASYAFGGEEAGA